MKKQITKISVHQSSKVLALLYFVLSAIICIPIGFFGILNGKGEGAIAFFLLPFLYGIATYITFAIICWLYNKIASYFGGIEIGVEEVKKANE